MNKLVKKSNKIKDLLVISPDIYYDFRGENCELFNKKDYKKILDENNIHKIDFVVDSFSFCICSSVLIFLGSFSLSFRRRLFAQILQQDLTLFFLSLRGQNSLKSFSKPQSLQTFILLL